MYNNLIACLIFFYQYHFKQNFQTPFNFKLQLQPLTSIFNFQLQISTSNFDFKLQTSTTNFNYKLQTSNFELQTSNFNFKLQTSISNFKLQLQTSNSKVYRLARTKRCIPILTFHESLSVYSAVERGKVKLLTYQC